MIVTVTLNPCIDETRTVAAFTRGGMNRVIRTRRDVAGKGVNVSAALKHLGTDSLCLGINYRENGRLMADWLEAQNIRHDFSYAEGAIRVNIKLHESDTDVMTEINQPGAYAAPDVVEDVLEKIKKARPEIIVLSGSRPQGVDADVYARIIASAEAPVILDTEGEALLRGLAVKEGAPYLIKPNLFELETAFGITLRTREALAQFCLAQTQKSPRYLCVSMGKDGALLAGEGRAYYAAAPEVPVRGLQGAGDSMVAGIVHGMTRGLAPADWLRCAVAAAGASVMRDGTQLCTREGFEEMWARVAVTAL